MKRIDQQEIENENKNETGAVLPQGPPQENPSWENDPNTKRTYETSYNLIRGVAEPILRHLILGFLLLRAQVARRKSSGSHTRQQSGDRRLGGGGIVKESMVHNKGRTLGQGGRRFMGGCSTLTDTFQGTHILPWKLVTRLLSSLEERAMGTGLSPTDWPGLRRRPRRSTFLSFCSLSGSCLTRGDRGPNSRSSCFSKDLLIPG